MPNIFFPGVRPSQFTQSRTVITSSRASCARSATDIEIRVVTVSPWASVTLKSNPVTSPASEPRTTQISRSSRNGTPKTSKSRMTAANRLQNPACLGREPCAEVWPPPCVDTVLPRSTLVRNCRVRSWRYPTEIRTRVNVSRALAHSLREVPTATGDGVPSV